MTIGASLVLIALGAILKYAVTAEVNGIDLSNVGIILMIVGAAGLVLSLIMLSTRRRTDVVHHNTGTTYIEPVEPGDPRI